MKELFLEELNKIDNLEQRKLLKDILTGCFSNLLDYQETVNRQLTDRVFAEVEDAESHYEIYMTVCHQSEVDPIDRFLFPVFMEDLNEIQYDMGEIVAQFTQGEESKLFTIFIKCEYPELKKLWGSAQTYRGMLRTNLGECEIKVVLKSNRQYLQEIERLYHLFHGNGVRWRTVNYSYANRFFDVFLVGCNRELSPKEEIKEITFDLAEYEAFKMTKMVLLWNIERLSIRSKGFPVAAIDRVNYEHVISIVKLGADNGFLVDEDADSLRYLTRTESEMAIICPEERSSNWNLLKITQPTPDQKRDYPFPLVSNSRNPVFINHYAQKFAAAVRTKAELIRILGVFEASRDYELEGIELSDHHRVEEWTYDMNFFILDDIRIANDQKIMTLKFKALTDSFLRYDLLSFLVSEVQMYFPEYECHGVLV